jgi:hypothetical protein
VTPYSPVHRFEGTHYLHFQGGRVSLERSRQQAEQMEPAYELVQDFTAARPRRVLRKLPARNLKHVTQQALASHICPRSLFGSHGNGRSIRGHHQVCRPVPILRPSARPPHFVFFTHCIPRRTDRRTGLTSRWSNK